MKKYLIDKKNIKFLLKILIIKLLFIILCRNVIYAMHPHEKLSKNEIEANESYRKNVVYIEFLDALIHKENYSKCNICRVFLDDCNNNLVIGCSTVAYMSIYAQELVDSYKYDIVGFGGAIDQEIFEWLKLIDKKYNTIVIWGSVNDIMNTIQNNVNIGNDYFSVLDSLLGEAERHLKNSPDSKIVFVNVKEMISGLDIMDKVYCDRYNFFADKINKYIKMKGIISINVESETTENNSEWYLHYTNKEVFNKILQDVSIINIDK